MTISIAGKADRKAYIITGPTSGFGRATALNLAEHGNIVLVGRDQAKLNEVQTAIKKKGQLAVSVTCDLSDLGSVRRAAAEIVGLNLQIVGLLNNAGIMQTRPTKNARGWDMTFATNYLGPFALTDALLSHLPDGANVVFIASAVEDPQRKPAVAVGFRGGRFVSVEASTRGEWSAGGAKRSGFDAYATSKQADLAAALALARQTPRLRFNVIEPGLSPTTALSRDNGAVVGFLSRYIIPLLVPLLMPFMNILTTPQRAARMITKIVLNPSGQTGVYYNERGEPMLGSELARDPEFQDRVVAETRALLSTIQS